MCVEVMSVKAQLSLLLGLFLSLGMISGRVQAQTSADSNQTSPDLNPTSPGSNPPPSPSSAKSEPTSWVFPVHKLNQSVPHWLHFGGEYRARFEGPINTGYKNTDDNYLLNRLRVVVGIEPKDWIRFLGEVQDARIFFNNHIPSANPYRDTWTLWQGYAQVGRPKEGWVDALAGRQVLTFGDERVIGPSNWLNVGRTFDVARIDVHHPGYEVAIFGSSVVPGSNTYLHRSIPGNNFYGIYGTLQNVIPRASFEPYVLWRLAPGNFNLPETVGRGHLNEVTAGLHAKGDLPANFDYDLEFDGQTGSLGSSSIRAWAGFVSVGKTFPKVATAPRVFLEGNYASGTKNPAGRNWNTFDQLYPSNHDKFGFADQVGRRNLEQFRTGVEENVTSKLIFKQALEGYWLATTHDNFYNSAGAIAVAAHPGASPHIGNEFDAVAEYQPNKGINIGFGYARLFAGQFLKTAGLRQDYGYPYAYVEYNFSKSGFHFPITRNRPPQ